jgi:hypothetical protein
MQVQSTKAFILRNAQKLVFSKGFGPCQTKMRVDDSL